MSSIPATYSKSKPLHKNRNSHEHNHQCALINWWAIAHKAFHLPEFALYSVPNGSKRNMIEAAWLKDEGMRAGIPDLELAVSRGGYRTLYIEMKHGDNKLTEEQAKFIEWQKSEGAMCVVCYDWTDARAAIEYYLKGK